jgi:hypothetical protein
MVALGIRRHPRDFRSITAFGRVLALSAARGVIRTTKGGGGHRLAARVLSNITNPKVLGSTSRSCRSPSVRKHH